MPHETFKAILENSEAVKLLLAIPTSLGGIMGLYHLSAMRSRNKLKTDLEMLKHYKEIDASSHIYHNMKERVERKIQRLFPAPDVVRTDLDRSDIFWACLLFIAGGVIWDFVPKNTNEWTFLLYPVVFGCFLTGAFGIYKGFERKIHYYLLGKGKKNNKQVDSSSERVGSANRRKQNMLEEVKID
jgi:hypothetical protein